MKIQKSRKNALKEQLADYSQMAQGELSQKAKTVGITVAAMAAGGGALDAAVVTVASGVTFNSGDGGIFINLDGDGVNDFQLLDGPGFASNALHFQASAASAIPAGNQLIHNTGGTLYAKRFSSGQTVFATSSFNANRKYLQALPSAYTNSQFDDGERGLVGVKFDIGGSEHLGFIDLEGTANGIIIHGWGYNDVAIGDLGGDSVVTQAVPEVSQVGGIGLLCVGAIGIAEMRRRREKIETAAKS